MALRIGSTSNKYGAVLTKVDGRTFHSLKEAARYKELRLLERNGDITGLTCQPRFPITVLGVVVCTYVADFRYTDAATGDDVVEDAKGYRTEVYKLKAKFFAVLYPELKFLES